ncbi:transcription factor iiia [Phtheirospermum japonicum]|uniref:Transcription factor iiia n=1 Tax=Phtheirospermum japonicum TaxID=374723 RepID=A0A830CWG9_9LAMI|nr:transcription factor iiia [Phtheirospermum japonicum]
MENEAREAIFRDIRRYYCEYCGICRSKKSLISSHILSHHQEMIADEQIEEERQGDRLKLNTCELCGLDFKKPAHLKQHMQSHSLERPFTCPVDDCHSSYRRKDHLTRHMIQHEGKLFECPVEECKRRFAFQCNMKRHAKELHDESASANVEPHKEYVCPQLSCGKVFKYPSKLRKHEDSHAKLDTKEAYCLEPGCMKLFANEKCLKEHLSSCHQYTFCDKCGSKQMKKNFKRHLCTHEGGISLGSINCSFDGCLRTFTTRSNLNQHIKAVHLGLKPYACSIPGCNAKFAFKHVRDKHEKSGAHVHNTPGNFEECDEQFRSRPRGGRKRKFPVIETLLKKRVVPPSESDLTKLLFSESNP